MKVEDFVVSLADSDWIAAFRQKRQRQEVADAALEQLNALKLVDERLRKAREPRGRVGGGQKRRMVGDELTNVGDAGDDDKLNQFDDPDDPDSVSLFSLCEKCS